MLPVTPKETEPWFLVTDQICQRFSLDEIRSATQNFDEALVIGRGGFGSVYKGQIKNGCSNTVVAIKRSNSMSNQGATEFQAEVEMLSKIRHCNLVSLIGYCSEGIEMALVYEYMSQGTLEDHLHKSGAPLSWLQLLKICIGAAHGLDYLHTGTGTQHGIIHRDVKSSNVLLDKNFAAKISDFGLAKIGPTNQTRTHVSTLVKGTFGYMDPRYFHTGNLTIKSDVYSFGVLLLEVICGRPALDTGLDDEEQWSLAPWAQDRIKEGKLNHIIDSRLTGQISSNCLKDFARIACRCLDNQPNQRPTMAGIIGKLEVILELQERLDSRATEGKLIDKVLLFFSGANNLIPTRPLSSEGSLQSFSYNVLKTATRNFRTDLIMGEGNLRTVFKGWINEPTLAAAMPGTGTVVAVERLNIQGLQGHQEWLDEINYLSQLNHPNLVKLIGYCLEDDHRLLVYEFMHRGSLENHLFESGPGFEPLSWNLRIKIALGAAKGLAYLHSQEKLVSCDIKSSCILVDSDHNAKLFSFMWRKHEPLDPQAHPSNQYEGYVPAARAYVPTLTGNFTARSNIYSFGVVLLEVLTGKRKFDPNRPLGKQYLVDFARPYLQRKRKIQRIIDRHLKGQLSPAIALRFAFILNRCLFWEQSHRPTANKVVKALEELHELQEVAHCLVKSKWFRL